MSRTIELLPAVDLLAGGTARVSRGELGSAIQHGDPVSVARDLVTAGARWLHVADLEAALGRGPRNLRQLADIVTAVAPARVQAAGGVVAPADLEALLDLGAARVVIGTAALGAPSWVLNACATHGDRVAVGLDADGSQLWPRGADRAVGELFAMLTRLDGGGCARFVYADVRRDGTLAGPSLVALRAVLRATGRPVIVSGGVGTLADLRELAALAPEGLDGVVVGRALHAGRFTLAEALSAVAGGPGVPSGP